MSDPDFPEPLSFNGDEDDRDGGYINRSTGSLRQPGISYQFCEVCGKDTYLRPQTIYHPFLGLFCSERCAEKASRKHATAMDQVRR